MSENKKEYVQHEDKKELDNKQLEQVSGGGIGPVPKQPIENKYGAVGDMKKDPA